MSEFDLWDPAKGPDVSYSVAPVSFPAYEACKRQAEAVANYIGSLELTEENIKEVKENLAKCRKVTDALNRKRIDIKKQVLRDYEDFAQKVNELVSIVDDADSLLRGKVRELEERERLQKMEEIRELWDKRAAMYKIVKICDGAFEKFISPKYLNKTTTMKTVERNMVDWLEQTEKDLELLSAMGPEYEAEYASCLDLNKAIAAVRDRKTRLETVVHVQHTGTMEPTATFRVHGTVNITLARMLFEKNEVKYEEI